MGSELFSVKKKGGDPDVTITQTDLGTLGGKTSSSVANGVVSNPVRVVGTSANRAFYWTGNSMMELQVPSNTQSSEANDINVAGEIVGSRILDHQSESYWLRAIFWSTSPAQSIDLPTLTAARVSEAYALNAQENGQVQVVGRSFDHTDGHDDGFHTHAMLWTLDGAGNLMKTQDLQLETFSALAYSASKARDINDRGQVVGWVNGTGNPNTGAFLLTGDTVTVLDEENESYAFAVSDANPVQIAGLSRNASSGEFHAVLWTVGENGTVVPTDLGAAGFFTGITDIGQVAGTVSGKGGNDRATLWTVGTDGTVTTLDLGNGSARGIDKSSTGSLTRIVGRAPRKKSTIAVLWTVQ